MEFIFRKKIIYIYIYIYERKVNGSLLARCVFSACGDSPRRPVWGSCGKDHYGKFFSYNEGRANSQDPCWVEILSLLPWLSKDWACASLLPSLQLLPRQGQLLLHGFSVFLECVVRSVLFMIPDAPQEPFFFFSFHILALITSF